MRLPLLLLVQVCCVVVDGFAARMPKDPRRGVMTQLFGPVPPGFRLLRPSLSKRKEAVLRGRIASKRSMVDRTRREIEALTARSRVVTGLEQKAHAARVAILQRETFVIESQLVTLKNYLGKVTGYEGGQTRPGVYGAMARSYEMFIATEERSARVMFDQMRRKGDAWQLLREDAASLLRLGTNLSVTTGYMTLGGSTALLPHAAAIIARANKLEKMAPGILAAISEHEALPLVEPHLDTILDRLDEIEPFIPFVLENFDALVPYTGSILDHFESLVLYGGADQKYLQPLLPFLPIFAPLFDPLGPHLALCWPHLPVILPHLPVIAPYVHRFAPYVSISANADVRRSHPPPLPDKSRPCCVAAHTDWLTCAPVCPQVMVFYFGWLLRVKYLGRFIMSLPFLPRLAALLVKVLPRRPVRGYTCDYDCDYSGCDVTQYEAALTARRAFGCDDGRPSSSSMLPDELQTLLSQKKRPDGSMTRLRQAARRLRQGPRRGVDEQPFGRVQPG